MNRTWTAWIVAAFAPAVILFFVILFFAQPTQRTTALPALTPLASGSGVTILEYRGEGIRCIIANRQGTSLVCQVVPTPAPDPRPTKELEA